MAVCPDKKQRTINIVTVSAVFLLVLLLSYFCPLITDDLHFKFVWNGFNANTGNEVRVSSVWDIIESAKNYYAYSDGRVICHAIVFALVNVNKWVFAVLNAAVFVAAGWLIRGHMNKAYLKYNDLMLPYVYLSMFTLLPVWGDSVLWISGSVNYLWAGTAIIWAIYLIDKQDVSNKNRVLTCIAVLIASATDEIAGGMLTIILILRMITWRKKSLAYYYSALFCVIPGMGLVLTAPGNRSRMMAVDGHSGVGMMDALKTSYGYLGCFVDWSAVILIVIFATMFYFILKKYSFKDTVSLMTVTISCFAGTIALGFSGVVIQRALFIVIFPLLIPFWSTVPYFIHLAKGKEKFKAILFAVGLVAVLDLITMSFLQAGIMALLILLIIIVNMLTKGRIENPQPAGRTRTDIVFVALLSILIITQFVMFLKDVKNYDTYIEQTVTAMKEGNNEKLYSLKPPKQLNSVFFPAEGTIVSDYSVSWIYEYYVAGGGR